MDSIANFLTQIKNAQMVGKPFLEVDHSRMKEAISRILKEKGFIADLKLFKEAGSSRKRIHLDLSYEEKEPRISEIKILSKQGRRDYQRAKDLKPVKGGLGITVVSTSRGVMVDEEARKRRLGGEVICEVF